MNLYYIEQDENVGYDTYDSAVVAAETEEDAKKIHPSTYTDDKTWWEDSDVNDWATSPLNVKATFIGVAKEGTGPGVICSSFNAG